MIALPAWQGKKVAVMGLGKTGLAACAALQQSGAQLCIWDDGVNWQASLPVGLAASVKPYEQWDWSSLDALLLSPGIPLTHPAPHPVVSAAKQHGVRIISDIELLIEAERNARFVAITGTNGKSTTTALIGHILRQAGHKVAVGGNLGYAALGLPSLGEGGIYVLELSSYQLDLLPPPAFDVAVWLNISPDHLDRHGDMDGYISAKRRIFSGQGAQQCAIIGVDDAYSEAVARQMIGQAAQTIIPIMTSQRSGKGIWVKNAALHNPLGASEQVADLSACESLRGEHNHQNAAAAYAACWQLGVAHEAIIAAMHSFPGLAHRMQKVGEVDGISFINDSKATNADAAEKSLKSFEHIYWIAGGVAKAGGIESLAPYFPKIAHAFLIGEAAPAFAETLDGQVAYTHSGTLQQAVADAYAHARADGVSGAVVLLAPACASFDQFANFEQRGEQFAAHVAALMPTGMTRNAV